MADPGEVDAGLAFEALYHGDHEALLRLAAGFDWQASHPVWGTPLVALVSGKLFWASPDMRNAKLEIVRWCIAQGANPEQHAPIECTWEVLGYDRSVCIGGLSALALVSELRWNILTEWMPAVCAREDEGAVDVSTVLEVDDAEIFWAHLQKIMVSADRGPPKVRVLEGVINVWEKLYEDRSSGDVAFVARGDQEAGCTSELRAHSVVLQAASPVLAAMLRSSEWLEGRLKRVETQDSPAALENVIALVYTGCLAQGHFSRAETSDIPLLIETAEVAQRYQIDFLGQALALRLRGRVAPPTFEQICSFAFRQADRGLQQECTAFAHRAHRNMAPPEWAAWMKSLSPQVQGLVEGMIGQRAEKRRRLAL